MYKSSQKVESLEANLKQTKKVYGAAYTKLIMKVKKLEKNVKSSQVRRRAKIVVSDDEELEDPSKQGRISTDGASKPISTVGASMPVSTASMVDKGKAIMQESEPEQTTIKLQQRQERAGYEAAIRLQEQLNKEERKRVARVHKEANSFNVEECEDIQAIIKANKELALRIQAEEREKYSEAKKARLLLKKLSFDELKNLFEATMKRVKTFTPMESDFDRTIPKIADESSEKAAKKELEQEILRGKRLEKAQNPEKKKMMN
nr:hypothetical protein [Tanacetum cinerariifolium]